MDTRATRISAGVASLWESPDGRRLKLITRRFCSGFFIEGITVFDPIPEILEDLKNNKMVIVVDDEDRENEGDLVMAAASVKPEDINFMAKFGRGLICVPMEEDRLRFLELDPMLKNTLQASKEDPFKTAWMISVDAAKGVTTGISAYDRARTIEVLINPQSGSEDLMRPGHIFPLRARRGGVLVRAGHTEASLDLMNLAGLYPAGVICEIMNDDGSMARLENLLEFSKKHNLKICTIASLIEYRRKSEKLIEAIVETKLPTKFGEFKLIIYRDKTSNQTHIALTMGTWSEEEVLVRVHSECLTGDVFGSLRCDCGRQLEKAMEIIGRQKQGVILYMSQEGRGIGLVEKLRAYNLQDKGLDTVEANEALGYKADLRDYGIGAQMLVDLGIKQIKLLTNNPRKIVGLEGYGLKVSQRIPLEIEPNIENYKYLKTKKDKLGHQIEL
jgi:3,4-dihydroxy 2-butanone 4-phosphate synthase/GTP cyclohydrolase II